MDKLREIEMLIGSARLSIDQLAALELDQDNPRAEEAEAAILFLASFVDKIAELVAERRAGGNRERAVRQIGRALFERRRQLAELAERERSDAPSGAVPSEDRR